MSLNLWDVAAEAFYDFCKSFECVNNETLLGKHFKYRFKGVALQWFRSFMAGRIVRSIGIVSDVSWIVTSGFYAWRNLTS